MLTLSATRDDVLRWREQGRDDILQYASVFETSVEDGPVGADLWFSPRTGMELPRCPFVRKARKQDRYICLIYDTRPDVCRQYPKNVHHMTFVGCEMLEPCDTQDDVDRFNASGG